MFIRFNKVTWYSKLAAVIVFVGIILLAIYIRGEYKKVSLLRDSVLSASSSGATVSINGDVAIVMGGHAVIDGLQISLDQIVKDSRCPVDVRCIQAGAVTALVTLKSAGKYERINLLSDGIMYRFDNYTIRIVRVSPTVHSKTGIDPKNYVVVFHIINVLGA